MDRDLVRRWLRRYGGRAVPFYRMAHPPGWGNSWLGSIETCYRSQRGREVVVIHDDRGKYIRGYVL